METSVVKRFLRYIAVDTQSAAEKDVIPSTAKQFDLAKILVEELKEMGAQDVKMDDHAYVYATVPATSEKEIPVLGLIAHMDTSPAVSGTNVKPRMIANYDGTTILLNSELGITLNPAEFPELNNYIGKTLIVTDGTTLLGADDKAGVAEIMTVVEYLLAHPEIPHGAIRIGFTPDEEVGCGADHFDVKRFDADFAYTVDGGALGELEYENFNAASGKLVVRGRSVHPGSAKNKMLNAILLGMEFQHLLPVEQNPMYTEGYEGFFHLDSIQGDVEQATLFYIIRDHDRTKFERKKELFMKTAEFLNEKYGQELFLPEVKDSYYNMLEQIKPHMHLIDNAKEAMKKVGVTPRVVAIRGGTDGARLSFMGLPCPNLCTGGENFHGRQEFACAEDMETIVEILKNIVSIYAEQK